MNDESGEEQQSCDEDVAHEVAEAEFRRFVEAMDLDVDPEQMDADDRREFIEQKRVFLRAVRRGRLRVDDKGQPVFTPKTGDPLVFHEPDGAALMEMDRAKDGKDVKKAYILLSGITKTSVARFSKMRNRDLKICQAILAFFMGG